MASRMIFHFSSREKVMVSLYPSIRTMKYQTTIRARPMKMPGNRPIMNSLVMDRPLMVAPSRMKLVLGGMMGPRMAPEAMTPPARPGL